MQGGSYSDQEYADRQKETFPCPSMKRESTNTPSMIARLGATTPEPATPALARSMASAARAARPALGSTRAKVGEIGDISGIDAGPSPDDVPAPGSVGKGKSGSRARQMSDGGLSGKTRGGDSETLPNQESASQQDDQKRSQM
jgi:hypothetical protein